MQLKTCRNDSEVKTNKASDTDSDSNEAALLCLYTDIFFYQKCFALVKG